MANERQELERLRKMKRLRELEAKAGIKPSLNNVKAEATNDNIPVGSVGATDNLQPVEQEAQPISYKEERSLFGKVSDFFTGDDRETRATKELPEFGEGSLLFGEDRAKGLAITPALLTATDPNEIATILKSNFPNIGIQYDEKGNVIAANNKTGARVVLNKPGVSQLDILQGLGLASAFSPAGMVKTGLVKAAAAGGGISAGIEGLQELSGGEFDASQVALDAGLGAGGKLAENAISAGLRSVKGTIPSEAAAIIKAGEEFDVPVLTTDVIQPDTLPGKLARSTGETIPIVGTSGVRASQQKGREKVAEAFSFNVAPSYAEVVSSLKAKTKNVMKAAGNRLEAIGSKMDEVGEISTASTLKSIDDEIALLTSKGRVPDDATIEVLNQYKTAIEEGQSFTSLDTLRSDFRESVKGDRMSLPTRSDAAMSRVYSSMTRDLKKSIDAELGPSEVTKWANAKGFYGKELEMLKKTRLKSVLDKGDVTPENVKGVIFSKKPSEMSALYSSLDSRGRAATRATIINEIVDRASKKVGGLSPNSLATEINKAGPQIGIFFKGEERRQLKGLQKFLDATRRSQDAAVATPTGQSLAGILAGGGVIANPTVTIPALATAGGLARVYESAPVRNALLRLSSIEKGTTAYDKAITKATQALTTAAQAAKQEGE